MDGKKIGYLTEKNGKPSSSRLKTTAAVFLGFLLILAQSAAAVAGYLKGLPAAPDIVSWDTLLLLFGYGGFTAAANKMAENRK